jgi:hypothetical protein
MRIICSTRFDITATEVRSNFQAHRMPFVDSAGNMISDVSAWQRSRNQQRNWETLNQIVSLRVLPTDISIPVLQHKDDVRIWTFDFSIDNPAALETDGDPLGELKRDTAGVPMIIGLNESSGINDILVPGINVFFEIPIDK